ncbi:uncharacterized protein LOC123564728 [Mercenaria mercenaria]|uniref:uncharacterized protein LOC123564728 n=1 Tax=Mercenaria mercenaria TaxID=6596 RepID=UPI00234EC1A3|nr:uncharacterized protein LOC123564728 [Mercenaria mercenaria]
MSAHTATNSTPAVEGFIPDPDNSTMDTEDSSREMGIGGWVGKEKETFSDTGSARRRLVITEEDEEDATARPLEDILDYSTEEAEQEDTIRETPMDNSTDTEDEPTKPVSRNSKRIILSSPEDVTPRKKSGPKKSPYGYKRTLTRSPGLRTPKKNLMNTYDYTDGTKGRLSSAGFYAVPIGFEKQEVFLKLGEWYAMQGKCNKEQSVKNVVRLTYLMGNKASRFNIRNITADRYILANEFLRSHNVDVQTLINYNKCMKHFFDFYLNDDCINLKQDDRGEYDRVKAIKYKFGLIFKQLEKEARDRQRQKKATELNPATPYEVQTVLRVAKPTFEKSMEACKQRVLSKVELAEVNRYIAAFVCLAQGNWPSMVTNVTAAEYHTATSQAPIVKQGQKYWVVMVGKHKTALQYDANIVLDEYWKEKFQSYNKYIRQQRVQAKNTENDNFILQHDGQPFVKVSHGLTQLHRKYKLHPEYTANDARKSFETYSSRFNKELRKDISNYLAHSEHVANTHYRAQGQHKAVETTIQLKGMYQYYTTRDRDDHPQAYELTEGSVIEGEGEVEQQEPQEGTSTGGETSQGDETEETNANNIATPPR